MIEDDLDQMSSDGTDEPDEYAARAFTQLKEERAALDCARKLLEELRQKASVEAVAEAKRKTLMENANITFGANNHGFQTGIINGSVSGLTFGR